MEKSDLNPPVGYSGKPLIDKLGIKPGMKLAFLNAPLDYHAQVLGPLPPGCIASDRLEGEGLDFVQAFFQWEAGLEQLFPRLRDSIHKAGMVWISWPKKTAKLPGDLSENAVRDMGLAIGLVDVKVCAVDLTWSGLKFVWRKAQR